MSLLSNEKFRRFFWLTDPDDNRPVFKHVPTLEEQANEAAAERGFAFDLLDQARAALDSAAALEAEVAAESVRRAEQGRISAEESARRILEIARASAERYEELAERAQSNNDDDYRAAVVLKSLVADHDA